MRPDKYILVYRTMDRREAVEDANAIILELRARNAPARAPISLDCVRQAFIDVERWSAAQQPAVGRTVSRTDAHADSPASPTIVLRSPADIWRIPGANETVARLIATRPNVPKIRELFEACLAAVMVTDREKSVGCMMLIADHVLRHDLEIQRAVIKFMSPMFIGMMGIVIQLAVLHKSNDTLKGFLGAFKDMDVPLCPAGRSKKDIAIDAMQSIEAPAHQIDDLRNWEDTGDAAGYNGLPG